jgi:hypothetical protein
MKQTRKIPALPYMILVAQFARAKGLRFFTWAEQMNAITLYESNAARYN